MRFVLLLLVISTLSHAFHATQHIATAPFGPTVPSTYFQFDNLQTLHSSSEDTRQWLTRYLSTNFELVNGQHYLITDSFRSHSQVEHIHLQQVERGVRIANAVMNINVLHNTILSIGSSFVQTSASSNFVLVAKVDQPTNTPTRTAQEAVQCFAEYLGFTINPEALVSSARQLRHSTHSFTSLSPGLSDIDTMLELIHSEGKLVHVWNVQMELDNNWFNAYVDAESGRVVSLNDWVSHASYNVFPLGTNDPLSGQRRIVSEPALKIASPKGWHSDNSVSYKSTRGNNVAAQENDNGRGKWEHNFRPESNILDFDFSFDLAAAPSTYINASITNLFYWNNICHDLFYAYGFDEQSGNFQQSNGANGGEGGDFVIANAQDGSGYNNANFATPPDGRNGRMRMYVWDVTDPNRDGDFESGIIIHEYSHGVSTRLTGGPANSNCLGWGESGGMGEGWGDLFATILQMTPDTKRTADFTMGSYSNGGKGIRKFPYSTDMHTNPSTYKFIKMPDYDGVHAKGEVWAAILYDVYWNIVDKHGFNPDWFSIAHQHESRTEFLELFSGLKKKIPRKKPSSDPVKHAGNLMMLQLVIDGMKLQPCHPSFVNARDAIIQADKINNGGDNECALWTGFAKRGLGISAKSGGKESFDLPEGCFGSKTG